MELLIFSVPTLISLFGGIVILARSGARYGRTIAVGLLFLSLTEAGYTISFLMESIAWMRTTSIFEVSSAVAFLIAVTSMEKRLAKNRLLIKWEKYLLSAICVLYASFVFYLPEQVFIWGPEDDFKMGWVSQLQSIFILLNAVTFMWIMENILYSSTEDQKRILKYPALGIIALGTAFVIMSVSRLSTMAASKEILVLYSLIFLVGMSFVIFFSIRFRLFEMDIFVSRYVVYHSATFLIIGTYLLGMGLFILGIQHLGMQISFVGMGFFIFIALFLLAFILISKEGKARLKFFINTHFFSNKYDYRKEWGELSGYLSIAFNEKQIIHVTSQVILDSMYINELSIWLRDGSCFKCGYAFPSQLLNKQISQDEPLVEYLAKHSYFLRKTSQIAGDPIWETMVKERHDFLEKNKIELAASMMVENRLIGFIAVGKENPGTPYGRDDIDLLTAIASQSSAALMSARFAQELASNKELDTFNRMSSYVLHDLKNAAGNLSLILHNAPNHMNNEEFRSDMLDTITQTLKRIDKVMFRLGAIPSKGELAKETVLLDSILDGLLLKLAPRLQEIAVDKSIETGLEMKTDPEMLERILENIVINATESLSPGGMITIHAGRNGKRTYISIMDNGTGMTEEFIRDRLFKPFQTTKKNGTGLGLWQVKNIIDQLGGTIDVESNPAKGSLFCIHFPD